MKIVNPIGRIPNHEDITAYACICNVASNNHSAVKGNVPCNVCAFSCSSNPANFTANQNTSTTSNRQS